MYLHLESTSRYITRYDKRFLIKDDDVMTMMTVMTVMTMMTMTI